MLREYLLRGLFSLILLVVSIRVIPSLAQEPQPALEQLIYSTLGSGRYLYLTDETGQNPRNFTAGIVNMGSWSLSPAHGEQRVALLSAEHSDRPDPSDLYTLNLDGATLTHLAHFEEGKSVSTPSWSADGQQLAFIVDAKQGESYSNNLYVMNADGTNLQSLTDSHNGFVATLASWLPDGQQLVVEGRLGDKNKISLIKPDGSNSLALFDEVQTPSFGPAAAYPSPDGQKIALGHFQAIEMVNRDGSNRSTVITCQSWASGDCWINEMGWLPDGQRLFLVGVDNSETDGPNFQVYLVNSDGTNLVSLTSHLSGRRHVHPALSADGQRLAFVNEINPDEYGNPLAAQLQIMNLDGSNLVTVSLPINTPFALPYPPVWSPAMKSLAFRVTVAQDKSIFNAKDHLYVVHSDGTNLVDVTADGGDPVWLSYRLKISPGEGK